MKTGRLVLLAISLAALVALAGCGSNSNHLTTGTFANSSFKGNYTFLAIGSDTFGPGAYEVGGVMVADGNGTITGGEQTYDNLPNVVPDTFTGTYSISSTGLGTVTLNTGDTTIGVNGTETFTVVLLSTSKALITQFDASATSSGTVDLQSSTTMPTGGYAFSVIGADVANNFPLSFGGVFNIDNNPTTGTISGTGSVTDINDAGSLSLAQTLDGSVSTPDSFGKVAITLTASGSTAIAFDGYIVDGTHIRLVEDDAFGVAGGTAISQGSSNGTFTTNAAFSGNFVFGFIGQNIAGPGADAGVITADGAGNLTGLTDQNQGGFVISDTLTGTYAVDGTGTGRVVATTTFASNGPGPSLIFYLTGTGSPIPLQQVDTFAVGSGTAYTMGSAASFNGTYGVGFTATDPSTFLESDGVAQITSNSTAGTFSGTANINEALVPASGQTFTGTFMAASGGRSAGTLTVNGGTALDEAFYFVDSTQGFVIETDATAVSLGEVRQQIAP